MIHHQCTIGQSVSVSGASLHTGEKVVLTLHPAPAGHGRKFKRIDLPDEPIVEARVEHVKTVERATTIAEGSAKVQTVEHVLSALTGMGVDNCLIEMDANEPPIGDGSAQQYVELIKKAGIVDQNVPRAYYEIAEPIPRFLHECGTGGTLHTVFLHGNHSLYLRKGNRKSAHVCFL
jgi:UDP-3-O-[3-hydroxymyristoyl] N-acetylglucosamine deacetylase / 3-hydroxyacyl-[acyl-carrier-protein] dehydratase